MKTSALILLMVLTMIRGVAASPLRDALAMFESGATTPRQSSADFVRGGSGEISRFQILPAVWREHSSSRAHTDPEVAWDVAKRILDDRIQRFQSATARTATPMEMYLLWNKPGHFAQTGFEVARVRPLYRERAQRFENLFLSLKNTPSIARAQ